MKKTNIVLSLLIIGSLIAGSIAAVRGQEDSIAAVFDSETSGQATDVAAIIEGITASDVVEAEAEVEAELESENDISIVSAHQTLTTGNGWIVTSNGKAALANILFVSKQAANTAGNELEANAHGWIKLGKLKIKLQSTQNTETLKSFTLNSDHDATGSLVLKRSDSETYSNGIGIWRGDLTLRVGEDESFKASVVLALQEKIVGAKKFEEYKEQVKSSYNGVMQLGDLKFKLQGTPDSKNERLAFQVYGSDDREGKVILEKVNGVYTGKIDIRDGDNRLSGKLKAELTRDGDVLSGPITAELDKHYSDGTGTYTGTITIYEEKSYSSTSAVQSVKSRGDAATTIKVRGDGSIDDSSDKDTSGKEDSQDKSTARDKNEGFWKRILKIFGAD
ncbi:MAG: hypothetical protein AABY40_01275 [Nanoarchaeota archaeon]|mgnify:CR=1 FL=1